MWISNTLILISYNKVVIKNIIIILIENLTWSFDQKSLRVFFPILHTKFYLEFYPNFNNFGGRIIQFNCLFVLAGEQANLWREGTLKRTTSGLWRPSKLHRTKTVFACILMLFWLFHWLSNETSITLYKKD